MKYRVVWTSDAEADLATIWLESSDRSAVSEAANRLDVMLTDNPNDLGESRQARVRVMFVSPLGIEFEFVESESLAYILAVWTFGRREGTH